IMIDTTAPFVAGVRLLNPTDDPALSPDVTFVSPNTPLIVSIEAAEDLGSIEGYQAVPGKGTEIGFVPGDQSFSGTTGVVPVAVSPNVEPIVFQGQATNTNQDSTVGYSLGVVVTSAVPEVTDLRMEVGSSLVADWKARDNGVPVRYYNLEISGAGGTFRQ